MLKATWEAEADEDHKTEACGAFYAAAAVWLAYALVLPLYEPLHYALAAGGSLLAFAAAAALCRGGPVGEGLARRRRKGRGAR